MKFVSGNYPDLILTQMNTVEFYHLVVPRITYFIFNRLKKFVICIQLCISIP